MRIATVEQMRRMDQLACTEFGIGEGILMENAGFATWDVLREKLGKRGRIVVLCGPGNNGGDGLAVARKALSMGLECSVLLLDEAAKFKGAAKANLKALHEVAETLIEQPNVATLRERLAQSDVIVDALLGTGLTREVEGTAAQWIAAVNESQRPVLAVDIPSGICGDTGAVRGTAIRATWTITFGLPKLGNLLYPGAAHGGELHVGTLTFPRKLQEHPMLSVRMVEPELPARFVDAHKGTYGNLLVIGGSGSYYGAPALAAMGGLRAGAGYVRVACPKAMAGSLAVLAPEVVFMPQETDDRSELGESNLAELLEASRRGEGVVLGPGLSLSPSTLSLVTQLTVEIDKPLLIDGDGLTAISKALHILQKRRAPTVLTPHLGELARLTGKTKDELTTGLVESTREFARVHGCYVVAKGAHSLVVTPEGQVMVNMTGNDGMATPGSGDVLAGTIGAMIVRGLSVHKAIETGVYVHGLAGDLAAAKNGRDGLVATDILAWVPEATRQLRDDRDRVLGRYMPQVH